MATVQSVITKLDTLLLQGRDNFRIPTKIALLDQAKTEAWRVLAGSHGQANWFGHESQAITSTADDYFGPLSTAVRDYPLPNNFFQLRDIEVVTSGKEGIHFERSNVDDDRFQRERASQQAFTRRVLYALWGAQPGQIRFSLFPESVLELRLLYLREPTDWIAEGGTEPDEFPNVAHGFIAEWAATRAILGVGDRRFGAFKQEWMERLERVLSSFERDSSEPVIVDGFLEGDDYH